jgi:FkbM family methyltransferase
VYNHAIFGSGNLAKYLHKLKKTKKTFFIDETLNQSQSSANGIKVLHPDQAYKKYKNKIAITFGIFRKEINFHFKKKCLEKKYRWKITHFNKLLKKQRSNYYFWGYNKNPKKFNQGIKRVRKLLQDKHSIHVLRQHLQLRCNKIQKVDASKMWEIPKLYNYKNARNTFVDIGAYNGDSLQEFLNSGLSADKIIAFEPDIINFKRLKKYVKKIPKEVIKTKSLVNEAVYSYNGKIQFKHEGNQSSSVVIGSSSFLPSVKCRTLEFLMKEKNNIIIKIDAEGTEWEIIASTHRLIQLKKPILAISMYHKTNDIIDIPILLENHVSKYNFFLRSHSPSGADLYLYCIPKTKQKRKINMKQAPSIFNRQMSFLKFNEIAKTNFSSSARASGFPENLRNNLAPIILEDIIDKLNLMVLKNKKLIEIGPGVSPLAHMIASFCRNNDFELKYIDAQNILQHLPKATFIEHISDQFPKNIDFYLNKCKNAGAINCYSVSQYLSSYDNFIKFIQCAVSLLAPGGRLLLGDIPNRDMRMRFFNSKSGKKNKSFIFNNKIRMNRFMHNQSTYLNDVNLIDLLYSIRKKGYHAWIIPQKNLLPQSNRREDLLIERL